MVGTWPISGSSWHWRSRLNPGINASQIALAEAGALWHANGSDFSTATTAVGSSEKIDYGGLPNAIEKSDIHVEDREHFNYKYRKPIAECLGVMVFMTIGLCASVTHVISGGGSASLFMAYSA